MNIILAAHGNLAKEVLCSANMVFGRIDRLDTVSFVPGENTQDLKAKYRALIQKYDSQEQILFLTDLFGGSPYNAAFETVAEEERMDVITGLSLPMLIDVVGMREMDAEVKAADVYERLSGETYIKSCKALLDTEKEENEEEDEI